MKMTREQIQASLNRGEHVVVGGRILQPARSPRETRAVIDAALPALEPVTDEQGATVRDASGAQAMRAAPVSVDAVVLRGTDGKLTREGMVHTLRSGGSVLVNGEVIDHLEDLPDETTLAAGDETRLKANLEALDAQDAERALVRKRAQAALDEAQAAKKAKEAKPAEAAPKEAPKPTPATPPAAPTPQQAPATPAPPPTPPGTVKSLGTDDDEERGRRRR